MPRPWIPRDILGRLIAAALLAALLLSAGPLDGLEEEQQLTATDGGFDHRFGTSVSLSGRTLAVGADHVPGETWEEGAVYVFDQVRGVWSETAKLTAGDAREGDNFGISVSLDRDRLVVGSERTYWVGAGGAYVFERERGVWSETARLTPAVPVEKDWFGVAVAVDGDTIAVGAPNDGERAESAGAVYIFERPGTAWLETAKLTAHDGGFKDHLGFAVSVSGGTMVAGARRGDGPGPDSGLVYVFERVGGAWVETAKLEAGDGEGGDFFGAAVSVQGDLLVVGAWGDDDLGPRSGSAYVFERRKGLWEEVEKLRAFEGEPHDRFGASVSADGKQVLVGALGDVGSPAPPAPGAAPAKAAPDYLPSARLFRRMGGAWIETEMLVTSDGGTNSGFGGAVALDGKTALVGAWAVHALDYYSGAAYVYEIGPGSEGLGRCISGRIEENCSGLTGPGRPDCLHEQQAFCRELLRGD